MDFKLEQILKNVAEAATSAADNVSSVVRSASTSVGEKYDALKLNMEIKTLQEEQEKLFSAIGHTMYLVQTDSLASDGDLQTEDVVNVQQTIDRLLLLADQKQQEINLALQQLQLLDGKIVCATCGKVSKDTDAFCAACGSKLPDYFSE